jgi:hypothetical protein
MSTGNLKTWSVSRGGKVASVPFLDFLVWMYFELFGARYNVNGPTISNFCNNYTVCALRMVRCVNLMLVSHSFRSIYQNFYYPSL